MRIQYLKLIEWLIQAQLQRHRMLESHLYHFDLMQIQLKNRSLNS